MRERPILFSGPMVRAILEGRKSQTRRAIKPQPVLAPDINPAMVAPAWEAGFIDVRCPYGQPGDLLWVRETFRPCTSGEIKNRHGLLRYGYAYQADSSVRWREGATEIHDLRHEPKNTGPLQFKPGPWKPSIHMPRRASRLTLRITKVRVERLHEISGDDAFAEGVQIPCSKPGRPLLRITGLVLPSRFTSMHPQDWGKDDWARFEYAEIWEQINGKGSWDANPWVWVIEFERVEQQRAAA